MYAYSANRTFSAFGPLSPGTVSNSTLSLSWSDLWPSPWMAVWWTKTSALPSLGLMNPNPFVSLNHFTTPCITTASFNSAQRFHVELETNGMAQGRLDVLSVCASTGSFGDEPIQVNPESRHFPSAVSEAAILPNLCPISRPSEHSCSGRDSQFLHAPVTLIRVSTKDAAHESTRCGQRTAATNLASSQPLNTSQFIKSTRSHSRRAC